MFASAVASPLDAQVPDAARITGAIRIELSPTRLGSTSATYSFRFTDPASDRILANGHRVIVKIDEAGRPAPRNPGYREMFQSLAEGRLPAADERHGHA